MWYLIASQGQTCQRKALNSHISVMQMVGVLPAEGETSIAAARMTTQTRRPEQKLVHIFSAILDHSWMPTSEHEWSSELWSFMRKKEELSAMSNVSWMEIVMLQSWQIKDRQTRAEGKAACLSCPFMSRFRWSIRCWSFSVVMLQSHGWALTCWLSLPGFIRTSSMGSHHSHRTSADNMLEVEVNNSRNAAHQSSFWCFLIVVD